MSATGSIEWPEEWSTGNTKPVVVVFGLFVLPLIVDAERPTNGTVTNTHLPKSVISIIVLALALAVGLLIAKLVDIIHDRQAVRDNASDISEYTRDLLKAQLMLAFSKGRYKNKDKRSAEENARLYFKMWAAKVARNKARRATLPVTEAEPLKKVVVVVDNKPDTQIEIDRGTKPTAQQKAKRTNSKSPSGNRTKIGRSVSRSSGVSSVSTAKSSRSVASSPTKSNRSITPKSTGTISITPTASKSNNKIITPTASSLKSKPNSDKSLTRPVTARAVSVKKKDKR